MRAKTVRDLGSLVRSARVAGGMTQADLARELRVSRDWVVRLEKGHPRLEAQKVLDALVVVGLSVDVTNRTDRSKPATTKSPPGKAAPVKRKRPAATTQDDPFAALFGRGS